MSAMYDQIYYDAPSSLDLPPSLAGFRPIAGGHGNDWPDALLPLHYDPAPTYPATSDITQSIRNACAPRATARTSKHEGARPREKKHGCWMCEKSFDRPSTLRKHLLVHTGEKAFVCDTCGRRFGVASNLNRHVKRCILKPVHRPQMDTSPAKRTRDPDPAPSPPDTPKPPAKRRRRAPSPSQWLPQSLADFSITPTEYTKPTPVPLPPVTAYKDPTTDAWIEERNSWEDHPSMLPYHPCGWKGTLPGPAVGLGAKDVMNLGLVDAGSYVMGRLVMV